MNSSIHNILQRIRDKKAQYESMKPFPRVMEESFHRASRIELTYHSNAIEWNTLTLAETALVIYEKANIPWKTLREIYEARNHDQALTYIESLVESWKYIDEADILMIHKLILRDIDDTYAGRYRDLPVRIQGARIILPNPLKVPILMEQFAQSLTSSEADILTFSALKKYEFLAIHPFIDGNGRTSRLLWNYFLLRAWYPLSYIDIIDRPRYMNALEQMDHGNTEPYLLLIYESIERSLDLFLNNLL